MHRLTLLLACCCLTVACFAQQYDTVSAFKYPIQMDSVVVTAKKNGFDVNAFIRRVQTDTTFYKAFKSIRVTPFNAINDITVLGDKGQVVASLHSKTKQNVVNGCRTMQTEEQNTTGNFFKSGGGYNYYTAELYDYLFFTHGQVCGQNDIVAQSMDERGEGKMEKSKYQLKQLIFNPGAKISGVPFMGDKASIFDPEEARRYDFKILSNDYAGVPCYVFKVTPKTDEKQDVVFNELTTWFRKSDFSIVARDYSLSYSTMLYDFDVHMSVRTSQVGDKLLPTYISYAGNWHIITKKRERVNFITRLSY
jgi:hypothetical protein